MKKLLFAALASLVAACGSGPDTGTGPKPLETQAFELPLKDGQSRLVEKVHTSEGRKYRMTYAILGHIQVVRDTSIAGKSGKLVRTTAWSFSQDSTYEYRMSQLYAREEGRLSVYELADTSPAPGLWYGLFKQADYDTNVFFDRNTVAALPLAAGGKWNIRDTSDRWYIGMLEKEYQGKDTLEWGGAKRECLVFDQQFLGAKARSWIASIGMIKAEMEYEGPVILIDSNGVELDTAQSRESYALIALDPDAARIAEAKEASRKKSFDNIPRGLPAGKFPDHP